MSLLFNDLLAEANIEPHRVRLLKHHTEKPGRKTPYELWIEKPFDFEQKYQRTQDPTPANRTRFASEYWASFVCPQRGETLFVGLFQISNRRPVPQYWLDPISNERPGASKGCVYDLYDCDLVDALSQYRGTLFIDWGKSREWRQRADLQNKSVVRFALRDPVMDLVATPEGVRLAELDQLSCDHARKEKTSLYIERGPIGALVKMARAYRCQLCECLGQSSIAFVRSDGTAYAEAHHVFPISKRGSLGAGNIMVLCPNHHREVHYGDFEVLSYEIDSWIVRLSKARFRITRTII